MTGDQLQEQSGYHGSIKTERCESMYGAIIGDVVGSTYEFAGRKTKNFSLFPGGSDFTDDTIMTVAVAKALMRSVDTDEPFDEVLVEEMRQLGEEYPHPKGGYGVRFRE